MSLYLWFKSLFGDDWSWWHAESPRIEIYNRYWAETDDGKLGDEGSPSNDQPKNQVEYNTDHFENKLQGLPNPQIDVMTGYGGKQRVTAEYVKGEALVWIGEGPAMYAEVSAPSAF